MKKKWHTLQPDAKAVRKLGKLLNCHPITAAILINRKISNAQEASNFLKTSLNNVRPPFALKDMDAAVHRIYRALRDNEKILIFGDYDVDGVTATAVFLEFFRYIQARVSYYIPHRIKEGYSLQKQHIITHALSNQIDLIITADCGSSSHEAVATAQNSGIDVIITDHHNISAKTPSASAVVNPKRYDCTAGLDNLAGVGVAFSVLICLRKYLRHEHFWHDRPEPNLKNLCDLVALGTIGDMVPLVYENRIFAKIGIELINSSRRLGLNALREAAGIANKSTDADDIAFRLAPRLNAAGRMHHASTAVELLTTKDIAAARQIAHSLNIWNGKRQDSEKLILSNILGNIKKCPELLKKRTLVFWDPKWHPGILGIVASRIMEKYFRPVVLFTVKDGIGKGSARSIPGLNLFEALAACQNYLENFGGHAMAAGLTIRAENMTAFQTSFEKIVVKMTQPEDWEPKIYIDYELDLDEISADLIDELESLMPFGAGNPEPLFMARNLEVVSSKIVGKNHRKMVLRQIAGQTDKVVHGIHFNVDNRMALRESFDQIAFRLRWNRWNGKKTAQIIVEDV